MASPSESEKTIADCEALEAQRIEQEKEKAATLGRFVERFHLTDRFPGVTWQLDGYGPWGIWAAVGPFHLEIVDRPDSGQGTYVALASVVLSYSFDIKGEHILCEIKANNCPSDEARATIIELGLETVHNHLNATGQQILAATTPV